MFDFENDDHLVSIFVGIWTKMSLLEECELLKNEGWYHFNIKENDIEHVETWSRDNIKNTYKIIMGTILFVSKDDATLFKLRWT